jgi:hypothetical protein
MPSSLTPIYGLGSYGRTGAAVLISSPRNRIGNVNRIYTYYKNRGESEEFKFYLATKVIGTQYLPKVNPWSYI